MPDGREDEYQKDVTGELYEEKVVEGQLRRSYPSGFRNLKEEEMNLIINDPKNREASGGQLKDLLIQASREKAELQRAMSEHQPEKKEIGSDVFTIPQGGNVWTATKVMNERFGTNVPVQDVLRDNDITDETKVQPGTQIPWSDYIRQKKGMELLDEPER